MGGCLSAAAVRRFRLPWRAGVHENIVRRIYELRMKDPRADCRAGRIGNASMTMPDRKGVTACCSAPGSHSETTVSDLAFRIHCQIAWPGVVSVMKFCGE